MESRSPLALVVDDEADLAAVVAQYLRREGFDAREVHDGAAAVALARDLGPDLVILDLGLPGLDGVEVCRAIRGFSDCYIIMLTARADEADKLKGLLIGADDYVTKPFSPRELVVRVRVLQRRPRSPRAVPPLAFGDLAIDPAARRVTLAGRPVELTRTEFDVLAFLAAAPGAVHSRAAILRALWGSDWVEDDHAAEVHVAHIRQKLGPAGRRYVRTVRGVGYQIGDGT
ncbi:MAG: response regulator transcription factor [Propionibacteriaceae bacterium]|jgi:DNA-binding response OmpR family regulator|nr:response regulator transcription factor [Propionibacteriaceae bacterium]